MAEGSTAHRVLPTTGRSTATRWDRRGTARAIVLSAALFLVPAACSGGDDDPSNSRATTPIAPPATPPASAATPSEGDRESGVDATTSDTAQTTTTAEAPPTAPRSALAGWSDPIDLPMVADSSWVQTSTIHAEQLVAVGSAEVDEQRQIVVWRSPDGEAWEPVETTGLDVTGASITKVVSFEGQLIAIGQWKATTDSGGNNWQAIGWTSPDASTWERIEALPATPALEFSTGLSIVGDEVWITGYTAGAQGPADPIRFRVAADNTVFGPEATSEQRADANPLVDRQVWGSPSGSFVLRSSDGLNWTEASTLGLEFTEIHAVGASAAGTPLVGGTDFDDRVAVWERQPDATWTAVSRSVPVSGNRVRSIGHHGDSLIVTMSTGAGAVQTPDGAWSSLPSFTMTSLLSADGQLISVGWSPVEDSEAYSSHVAESADAVDWSGIELSSDQFLVDLVVFDDRLVATGSYLVGDDGRVPAAWIGGSRENEAVGEPLEPASWEPPFVPGEPIADLLRFDGVTWHAELANIDVSGAEIVADIDELGLSAPNDLVVAGDGSVWIATDTYGVYRLVDGAWTHFGIDQGLPSTSVRHLAAGPDGSLVAATGVGLAVFDGERFVGPELPPTITEPRIIDLTGDGTTVWASTGSGLVSWNGDAWQQHGTDEGLTEPAVVGGALPTGLATRLFPTDGGLVARFPGVGLVAWDGSAWTLLDLPAEGRLMTVGWDGSLIYAIPDGSYVNVFRRFPDGTTDRIVNRVQFSRSALDRAGTVWVTDNLFGLIEVRDGSSRKYNSLGGTGLGYVGDVEAFGNQVFLKGGTAMFVRRDGEWTAHTTAEGLAYPLGGSDNSFSTGAIYRLTAGPDGTVWALSFPSLPEWADTEG